MAPILILAAVAAFIAYRLYLVLGSRTGHEQTFATPVETPQPSAPAQSGEPRAVAQTAADLDIDPAVVAALRAISAADSEFSPDRFLEGARGAYRMILEAYWRDDEALLSEMVSEDVRASFSEAIAERRAAGHRLDNRLVTIERARIVGARLESLGNQRVARVSVRFDADIAAVTRDAEGNVIAGSMSDAVPSHDLWTFARTLRTGDPNWLLVETDESL